MKRFIISTLIISSILSAKSTYQPIVSIFSKDHNRTFAYNKTKETNKLIAGITPITNKMIEFNNLLSKINKTNNTDRINYINRLDVKSIDPMLKEAKEHLGKRYVWGAIGPKKFDCSGFTSYVCRKNGIHIPRTSIRQGRVGIKIHRKELKRGDLVFFDTSKRKRGYINHVGIYIGNQKFIHASSAKRRVVVTSLNKPFYKSRFKWGRRVTK